jgi:hypothetical protein
MRISEAHDYDLVGELIDSPEPFVPAAANPFPILVSA